MPRDVQYLFRQLCVFFRLRDEFEAILEAYSQRLKRETAIEEANDTPPEPAAHASVREAIRNLGGGIASAVRITGRFASRLAAFVGQKRRIDRLKNGPPQLRKLVLATASTRLHGVSAGAGPRRYLQLLATSLSVKGEQPAIDRQIADAEHIFVTEPLLESPLWKIRRECWNDGVFILDVGFLMFLGVLRFLTGKARYVRGGLAHWRSYRAMRAGRVSSGQAIRSVLAATLLFEGYRSAFEGPQRLQSCFFTSNSFATEILRFFLLLDRGCNSVCEIMHGIPTTLYERYLAGMLEVADRHGVGDKHSSIPQIPGLPMFGVLREDVKCAPEAAINLYLNRYVIERRRSHGDFRTFVASELRSIASRTGLSDETVVVTFIGGMSQHRDCFRSDSFRIECFILRQIKRVLRQSGRPHVVIYTPHPGYPLAAFESYEFFAKEGITVYPDTIFTWFLSDMCVSLFSSALFEAAYFGVHAFTPTIERDDLFPGCLLDRLHHPTDRASSSFVDELSSFLALHSDRTAIDFAERVRTRIGRFRLGGIE